MRSNINQNDEVAAAYEARLNAAMMDIPLVMLLDISSRLRDWASAGEPMDAPYVLHLVENAELIAETTRRRRKQWQQN